MRKILLATTALVAFAGAAHAAPASPISLNVGGYVDFVAGQFHESQGAANVMGAKGKRQSRDFMTEYKLAFDAVGKASNGIEYGANVTLWNGPEASNLWAGNRDGMSLNAAYVWMSGAFGKVLFGDEHGASDLVVYAPTVGAGQIDGRYMDFVDPTTLSRVYASGIDNTEHSTKITYYTPKVGNDMHKVQLGVSYTPNFYDYGANAAKYQNATTTNGGRSPYQDVIEAAVGYWGNFRSVNLAASANITNGSAGANGTTVPAVFGNTPGAATNFQDFTAWGLGAQAGFMGATVGASYQNLGRYGTIHEQSKAQEVYTLGGKYEFDKVAVAANWLTGSKYDNLLAGTATGVGTTNQNYVRSFNAYGLGATYTWFPGLTSSLDGVMFDQKVDRAERHNDGYVLLLSQRLAF